MCEEKVRQEHTSVSAMRPVSPVQQVLGESCSHGDLQADVPDDMTSKITVGLGQ